MCISIVIPSTGKRVGILIDTINSALASLGDVSGEVIVIKNESKVINIIDSRLKLIDVDFNNVSASRNLGAKVAANDLLCFIDDDMLISADNIRRFRMIEASTFVPYVVSAVWEHSPRVQELKKTTFLGYMLGKQLPNDSFKTRYKAASLVKDWQDEAVFQSAMTTMFWEACFSMRRVDYLRIGGMNEQFDFGSEGVDFLKRILDARISYFVDPTNVLQHNEWDKFNDWQIPEHRWRIEAKLVNEGKNRLAPSNRNYCYKFFYGVAVYAFLEPLRDLLSKTSSKRQPSSLHFRLFNVYSTAIYWHEIRWKTIRQAS